MKGRAKEHYSWFDNGEKFLTHHLVQLCNIITYVHTYDKKGRLEYYIPTKKTRPRTKKLPEGENMQRARFGLTFHIFRGIWCIVCNTTLILQKPLFGKKPQKHFYPTNYLEQQLKNSNISRSEIPHLFF